MGYTRPLKKVGDEGDAYELGINIMVGKASVRKLGIQQQGTSWASRRTKGMLNLRVRRAYG